MAQQQTATMVNGIDLDVLQETIEAIKQDPKLGKCRFRATNKWIDGTQSRTKIKDYYAAGQEMTHPQEFELQADEPPMMAGTDQAPSPTENLLNSLASCVATSMVIHAAVRGIHIEELESEIEGDLDLRGFLGLSDDTPKGFTDIRMKFKVKTDADSMEELKRLGEYSPTLNTLIRGVSAAIEIEPK